LSRSDEVLLSYFWEERQFISTNLAKPLIVLLLPDSAVVNAATVLALFNKA